jgi:hypothetical protein
MVWVVRRERRRALEEGVRTGRERLLWEISTISVDDVPELVPSKSSTSSSTCAAFDLDEDAMGVGAHETRDGRRRRW